MKFKTQGTFNSETLVDIAQRAVACLQDAGAERVAGVSVYLTVVDKHGAPCPLLLGDEISDCIDLDVADLALAVPQARLKVGKPTPQRQRAPGARAANNPTKRRRQS
ncbi:MAG: hypothetical protein KJ622_01475 [Alphaproteobacteria bacterium]|nr:hypothetical protein [Alphaproteobacteria bacterium]